jgi:protocatechuate 3,4-dioxygenase beta subunit
VTGHGVTPRRLTIDVSARQPALDLGDVVLEAGLQIRGRVRDKAGAPVVDAALRAYAEGGPRVSGGATPLEGRTDTDGAFVLGGATASGYRLMVQATGYAPFSQPVDAPSEGVEIVLDAAGGIAGLVVDDAGRPVETFEVSAQPAGGREAAMRLMPRGRAVTSEGGRFTLEDVAPGTYVVEAVARDLGRGVLSNVKVAAGAIADVGRIRLSAGGTIRGSVVDPTGTPVAAATV